MYVYIILSLGGGLIDRLTNYQNSTRGDYERYRYCLSRNAYHLSLRRSERTNQITTAKAIFDDIEYGVERVREKNAKWLNT